MVSFDVKAAAKRLLVSFHNKLVNGLLYKFILSDEEINDRIRIANRLIAEWEIQQGIML